MDRPLTAPRHWRRNVGRLVTAVLRDGTSETGRLPRPTTPPSSSAAGGSRSPTWCAATVQVEFSGRHADDEPDGRRDDADDDDDDDDADDDDDDDDEDTDDDPRSGA